MLCTLWWHSFLHFKVLYATFEINLPYIPGSNLCLPAGGFVKWIHSIDARIKTLILTNKIRSKNTIVTNRHDNYIYIYIWLGNYYCWRKATDLCYYKTFLIATQVKVTLKFQTFNVFRQFIASLCRQFVFIIFFIEYEVPIYVWKFIYVTLLS